MVNRVVDDADLAAETKALAEQIAAAPPVTVRMIKRATYQSAQGRPPHVARPHLVPLRRRSGDR